jgi:hypothetical protein
MGNKLARRAQKLDYIDLPRELRASIIAYNTYRIGDDGPASRYWGYFKDDPTREFYLFFIPKMEKTNFIMKYVRGLRLWHNIRPKIYLFPRREQMMWPKMISLLHKKCNCSATICIDGRFNDITHIFDYLADIGVKITIRYNDIILSD